METLMALKPDVARDLLCVIAHGTLKARVAGAHLLFYYWPSLNPTLYDRRGVNVKFSGEHLLLVIRLSVVSSDVSLSSLSVSFSSIFSAIQ